MDLLRMQRASRGLPRFLAQRLDLLEDFESAAEWGAEGADDLINYKTGSQSVVTTAPAGSYSRLTKTVSTDISNYNALRLFYYLHDAVPTNILVYLATKWDLSKFLLFTITSPMQLGWNSVHLPRGNFSSSGGASWGEPIERMRIRTNAAASDCTISYDTLRGAASSQAAIIIMFDDGYESDHGIALQYMRPRRLRATSFIITNYIGNAGFMSAEQLADLYAAGWDISNHSMSHPYLTTLSQAEQEAELAGATAAIDALGFARASRHVAYPYGAYNADTFAAMTATGMWTGRRTAQTHSLPLPHAELRHIPRTKTMTSATTLASVISAINNAITHGEVRAFSFHGLTEGVPAGDEWGAGDFRAMIDHIMAVGIPVITINDWYNAISGPIAVPR